MNFFDEKKTDSRYEYTYRPILMMSIYDLFIIPRVNVNYLTLLRIYYLPSC